MLWNYSMWDVSSLQNTNDILKRNFLSELLCVWCGMVECVCVLGGGGGGDR